jgi:hypothetical protein
MAKEGKFMARIGRFVAQSIKPVRKVLQETQFQYGFRALAQISINDVWAFLFLSHIRSMVVC